MKISAEEWTRIEFEFDAMLDLEGEARRRALERLATHDPVLHAEVLSLLNHTEDGDALLDQPALRPMMAGETVAAVGAAVTDLPAGLRIGAYRILRLVGRGGMGEVYLAERADGQYEQRVALKLLRRGVADHGNRFHMERQTLARLDHPRIARLLDGGVSEDGRPYMVMEFVQGRTIVEWCRTQRSSLDQRLSLFGAVCEAVAFAHRNLVVHRDIKPGNVLVTDDGAVKLLDFGVAKLLDPTDHAETQYAPMTPGYAAPEQVLRGVVTTATDVYALGMLLFELLTGELPWPLRDLTLLAALDKVLNEAPALPSRFASERPEPPVQPHELRGDLDAIVAKALRKEPEGRYGTVVDMQADIDRSLRHEPVAAREGARTYLVGRFLRRHRTLVVSAGLTGLALLVTTGITLRQTHQARIEAERAEKVKSFVLSILGDADTDSGAGSTTTAVDLLKSARRRVDEALVGQPAIRTELLTTIAYGLVGQGAVAEGADAAQSAVTIGTASLGPEHPKTLLARVTYGEALADLGRDGDAIRELRALIASTQQADLHQSDLAEARIGAKRWLASVLLNEGQPEEAVRLSKESVADARTAGSALSPALIAEVYGGYANVLTTAQEEGQVAAAREGLEWARRAAHGRVTADTLDERMLLGRALVNEGDPRAGLQELEATQAEARTVFGPTHSVMEYSASLLATARLDAGNIQGAIDAYRAAIAVEVGQKDSGSPISLGQDTLGLARSELAARRSAEAVADLDRAIVLFKAASGESSTFELWARSLRALAFARLGRIADAEREVAELDSGKFDSRRELGHNTRVAEILALAGRFDEAVARARAAVGRFGRKDPPLGRADAEAVLGIALVGAGRYAEAVQPLESARTVYDARQIMLSPEHAEVLVALARARAALGDAAGARDLAIKANDFWSDFAPASAEAGRATAVVRKLGGQS